MAALLGDRRAFGQAYNVTGEEVVTQVGFVDLVADVVKRPAKLVYVAKAPFGQNLAYEAHAVFTTHSRQLGIAPRYPWRRLANFEWTAECLDPVSGFCG